MKSHVYLMALLQIAHFGVFADTPRKLDDPKSIRSATQFAMTYTNALQAGKGAQAVAEGWDWKAIPAAVFGEAIKKHKPEEAKEVTARMLAAVQKLINNPQVAAALAYGKFDDYAAKADDSGRISIEYNFVAGDLKIPNRIVVVPLGGSWRIVEAETNGKAVVADLRAEYHKVSANLTPLQFMRLVTAELEKEKK